MITFEDLDAQGHAMGPLPKNYAGFTWSDHAWFMTKSFSFAIYPGVGFGLFNAHSKDITIESTHMFDLKELSLCTLWSEGAQVVVEGWEAQVRKYTTTLVLKRFTDLPSLAGARSIMPSTALS